MMFFKLVVLLPLLLHFLISFAVTEDTGFIYNGFKSANTSLIRDGITEITPNGLLRLTNDSIQQKGHAFYFNPVQLKNLNSDGNTSTVYSFSTTFVFGIVSKYHDLHGHGIAFFIAPSRGFPGALPSQYLGLFNDTNNGKPFNHVVAVELDINKNPKFHDINNNHVGIDIDSLRSVISAPASYFTNESHDGYKNLSLTSEKPMQVWIEYDGVKKQLDVTLAPFKVPKPNVPLLSLSKDLSPIILDSMYVGFSSATGSFITSHYILGWSFKINGQAEALDLSVLPKLPLRRLKKKPILIRLHLIFPYFVLMVIFGVIYIVRRKRKFKELVEDWEQNYRTNRFSYKDLYVATKGFREKEILGVGGFGKVFKGVLPTSKIEIAVKRVSHDSRQGLKEFIAEIVSIGQIRHRNLVQLFGYCRRKGELLLVYDFMPNGSLDKFLFGRISSSLVLNWNQRFRIIKCVASGLLYLHEGCEQVVIHRDIKASNVLLDGDMNARLSDFGLARLYDRGSNPQTTNVVGTFGYIAPELTRTGKATTATDVFAFGAFFLEVACGRRPIKPEISEPGEDLILVDWVFNCWSKGAILETSDPKLGNAFQIKEMELVLKLGLLCSHSLPMARPNMKQVVQYLDGDIALPAEDSWARDFFMSDGFSSNLKFACGGNFDNFAMSYPCSVEQECSHH